MKKQATILLQASVMLIALAVPQLSASESSADITGYWVMSDGSALIEIRETAGALSARIAALRDPQFTVADGQGVKSPVGKPRLDIHNTDSSLRGRPIQGLTIATGLHYERGRWRGGRIYDPASGKTYRCEMELAADGYLEVRGYIGIAALGRTLYWQRLENFRDTVTAMLGSVPKPV